VTRTVDETIPSFAQCCHIRDTLKLVKLICRYDNYLNRLGDHAEKQSYHENVSQLLNYSAY
jgi:hypothetical protein